MITGLHHVSMKCLTPEKFEEVKRFYCGAFGLSVYREWQEGVLIDTGNGYIEIFCNGNGKSGKGAVRHFALGSTDVELDIEKVRRAGYQVLSSPRNILLNSNPPYSALVAFFIGPLGEEVELFQEL